MSVVTRFPPSPTGFMHIGNARTALFNWLYARHTGGTFLMRIEDTDRERYSKEAVEVILDGLRWLELDWDNKGEIYSQYENRQRHIDVANELLAAGKAYYCYCTPEELERMRETARAEGRSAVYDRRWRDRGPSEAPEGVKPVVRIKAPVDGFTVVHDKVQGDVKVENKQLDDFILLRSDGTPTYMLSVVVDDHDMGVTHVLRGDDHLNNTFRQNVIYDALEWEKPTYAHLPLIHGPDGSKFSKRHGAQSVAEYREMGFLPEAMRNYLLRLGWSHGDEEIIPTDRAVELFELDGINKAAAKFDFAKLESLNAHYIKLASNERLMGLLDTEYQKRGLKLTPVTLKWIFLGLDDLKDRAKTIVQLADEASFYAIAPRSFNDKAQKALADSAEILPGIRTLIESAPDFSAEPLEQAFRDFAARQADGKLGKVIMPFRAALTGATTSPPIFKAAEIMGREETLARMDAAMA
ncbi:MAG: glutamate--tRNA ligase [Alphaproteobacteria bacterium]|nr:glutamate--tRNA ligase [Alphaproteobacteria bacterium]